VYSLQQCTIKRVESPNKQNLKSTLNQLLGGTVPLAHVDSSKLEVVFIATALDYMQLLPVAN